MRCWTGKGRKGTGCDVSVTWGPNLLCTDLVRSPSLPGPAGPSLTVIQQALSPISKCRKYEHPYGKLCWRLLPCSQALQVLGLQGLQTLPTHLSLGSGWSSSSATVPFTIDIHVCCGPCE